MKNVKQDKSSGKQTTGQNGYPRVDIGNKKYFWSKDLISSAGKRHEERWT